MHKATYKVLFLFGFLFLVTSCNQERQIVVKVTSKTIGIDSLLLSNSEITETISPYKEKMITEINTVISFTPKDLMRTDGDLESSLGNLIADLSYERVNPIFLKKTGNNIDFALFNYGGVRAEIAAGNVTNKNAFELMPFENNYVVTKLKGEKIVEIINYLIKSNTAHPLSKQVKLTISNTNYQLRIKGKTFDQNQDYYVLTTNYLQSGGDNMLFFKNPIELHNIAYKMRDAIVDHFKSIDTLRSNLDERFKRN